MVDECDMPLSYTYIYIYIYKVVPLTSYLHGAELFLKSEQVLS